MWHQKVFSKDTKFPPHLTHLPRIVFSGLKQSVCHGFLLDKYTALVHVYLFTPKEATQGFQWWYYKTELLSIIKKITICIVPSACPLHGFKSVSKSLFKGYEGWGGIRLTIHLHPVMTFTVERHLHSYTPAWCGQRHFTFVTYQLSVLHLCVPHETAHVVQLQLDSFLFKIMFWFTIVVL
jgi:hypothetical protein